VRILIADDHEIVRKGVCSILESRKDIEICGEASNGQEAVQKALQLNPDLVILDVTMPVLDGFAAARQVKEVLPNVPILMLSMHDANDAVREAH
jgi:DNA-binding NarL/FixJ family response regulator